MAYSSNKDLGFMSLKILLSSSDLRKEVFIYVDCLIKIYDECILTDELCIIRSITLCNTE